MKILLVYDSDRRRCRWSIAAGVLTAREQMTNAVLMSLLLDARSESMPSGEVRGAWSDVFYPVSQGSQLWTIEGERLTAAVADRARQIARAALQWLVDSGRAAAVDVDAQLQTGNRLALAVSVTMPAGDDIELTIEL